MDNEITEYSFTGNCVGSFILGDEFVSEVTIKEELEDAANIAVLKSKEKKFITFTNAKKYIPYKIIDRVPFLRELPKSVYKINDLHKWRDDFGSLPNMHNQIQTYKHNITNVIACQRNDFSFLDWILLCSFPMRGEIIPIIFTAFEVFCSRIIREFYPHPGVWSAWNNPSFVLSRDLIKELSESANPNQLDRRGKRIYQAGDPRKAITISLKEYQIPKDPVIERVFLERIQPLNGTDGYKSKNFSMHPFTSKLWKVPENAYNFQTMKEFFDTEDMKLKEIYKKWENPSTHIEFIKSISHSIIQFIFTPDHDQYEEELLVYICKLTEIYKTFYKPNKGAKRDLTEIFKRIIGIFESTFYWIQYIRCIVDNKEKSNDQIGEASDKYFKNLFNYYEKIDDKYNNSSLNMSDFWITLDAVNRTVIMVDLPEVHLPEESSFSVLSDA